jgi:CheY-like chemotaxis protein
MNVITGQLEVLGGLMAKIFIIDDDIAMDMLAQRLRYAGHDVVRHASFEEATHDLAAILKADLVVLDIIMPWPENKSHSELSGTITAGMELLREIREQNAKMPVIVYSAIQDGSIIEALNNASNTTFISKWAGPSLKELVGIIHKDLGVSPVPPLPRPFIVHGRNDKVKLELKNYLQNVLKLPEPIILHEQPSLGRTVIEKLEDYAMESSLAFVLLTPDDVGALAADTDDLKRRARQNVIYEMGYFHGYYGRESGRVIFLNQGPLDLPSDLAGIVYVDISNGIEAAGELIRKEVGNVISQS